MPAAAWNLGAALLLIATMVAVASAELSLDLSLGQEQAYPGETVPVTVTLRPGDAKVRNIGYPHLDSPAGVTIAFTPPVLDGDPGNSGNEQYRFSGQISGRRPGQMTVGPARLDLEIVERGKGSAAFFGAVEPRPQSLATTAAVLTILPLPTVGRPPSFGGAIGTFTMAVSATPARVAAGDPLTVITTIEGTGSLDDADCPNVTGPGIRSYPLTVRHPHGRLECEQVLIPATSGELPSVTWSYFDPATGRYRTLRQTLPSAVPSSRLEMVAAPPAPTHQPPSPLRKWSTVTASGFAAIVLTATAVIFGQARRRAARSSSCAQNAALSPAAAQSVDELERALADQDVEKFYTTLFSLLQRFVATASYSSPASITGVPQPPPDSLSSQSAALAHLFARCDRVRFGRAMPRQEEMRTDLSLLRNVLLTFPSPLA